MNLTAGARHSCRLNVNSSNASEKQERPDRPKFKRPKGRVPVHGHDARPNFWDFSSFEPTQQQPNKTAWPLLRVTTPEDLLFNQIKSIYVGQSVHPSGKSFCTVPSHLLISFMPFKFPHLLCCSSPPDGLVEENDIDTFPMPREGKML